MDINRTKFLEEYTVHVEYDGDVLNYPPEYTYERYDRNTDMYYGLVITKSAQQVAEEGIAQLEEMRRTPPPKVLTVEERLDELEKRMDEIEKRIDEQEV